MNDFRYGERDRRLARRAYQAFEPYHLVAYFGDNVSAARKRLGLRWHAAYAGMRAAPMGAVSPAVVTAAFFNFNPAKIEPAWSQALAAHGVDELNLARTEAVDAGLRQALGAEVTGAGIAEAADRLRAIISTAGGGGRALAAAYLALPWPDEPHLVLWQATTIWREWRGDGHIAALNLAGLDPLEALVTYDAGLREASAAVSSGRGRSALQPTRGWDDEEWQAAEDRLADRGLVGRDEDGPILTDEGSRLRQWIEDHTDDAAASVWAEVDDDQAEAAFARARPYVKAVIDSGLLPGTQKKTSR